MLLQRSKSAVLEIDPILTQNLKVNSKQSRQVHVWLWFVSPYVAAWSPDLQFCGAPSAGREHLYVNGYIHNAAGCLRKPLIEKEVCFYPKGNLLRLDWR